jgi:cyanophycinase
MTHSSDERHHRGFIVPIGGAEDKMRDARILRRFADLCGGADARIVVIPTASETAGTGAHYAELFTSLSGAHTDVLPLNTRADCADAQNLAAIAMATGIFLTGGNQLKLSTTLGGTPAAEAIRQANRAGVHVGGTSAGAAFLPEHMIAFGRAGASPRPDMVALAPGLGLTNALLIDQHFRQRDRFGRLLSALAYNPFCVALGLDEDTAAFVSPENTFEVVGSGGITVVDPSSLEYSSMDSARKRDTVCLIGLKLHVLVHGASYDMRTRVASVGASRKSTRRAAVGPSE